jgi:ribulose-phosphate 3-epimerase
VNSNPPCPRVLASFRGADVERWPAEVVALEAAGIDGLHLDVMDGLWVTESCFTPDAPTILRRAGARLIDLHLLVERPEDHVAAYLGAGVDRLTFHVECVEDPGPLLETIAESGVVPGLALLPSTPIGAAAPWLELVGLVNPLAVDPHAGTGFDARTFDRIAELHELRAQSGRNFVIQGDGGVWSKTRDEFVRSGVDELVGGHPIFSSDDYAVAIGALRDGEGG